MALSPINDNYQLLAPKQLDNRMGRFSAGAWRPYNDMSEFMTVQAFGARYETQIVFVRSTTNANRSDIFILDKNKDPYLLIPEVNLSNYYTKGQIDGFNSQLSQDISNAQSTAQSALNAVQSLDNSLATVAKSGDYNDLSNKPTPVDTSSLQPKTDNGLNTTSKTVVGGINELVQKPLKNISGILYLDGYLSQDGLKIINNYDIAGIAFNATIYATLPTGKTVDDVIWFRTQDGRFAKRDYGYALMGAWFGLLGDGVTDNTVNWNKILANLLADGGGRVDLGVGTFMLPPFSVPLKSDICGSSLGSTVLKLLPNSPAGIFVNCNTSYSGTIQDLTINGNRANQTNIQHGVGLSAAGGNSNYKMLIRRNLIEEFTGNGVHAVSPAFIYSVESNRIRNVTGWCIYNTSTDNGYFNNELALGGQGAVYNQGNNTRFIGGKILFDGRENPTQGSVFESSSRSQWDGVEIQECYYTGFELNGATYCKINIVSDMNNVARRPTSLGGLNNVGDPTAVGYALKLVNSQNNLIIGELVSSVVDGNLKFTQFGKSVDSASINNIFMLKEQPQFGPDSIISGGNNTFLKHQQFSNTNVDADFTVLMGNPNVRLSATLTADRSLVMLTAQESTQKQMVIYNQNPLSNAFKWVPSQPVYDFTGTAITGFPNASVIVLNQMQSGVGSATAQWRISSLYSDLYTKAEVDAIIKTPKVITPTGSSVTIQQSDFVGTNGEVVVLINATANFTLVLSSIPLSLGKKIRAIRIDNSNFVVSVKGRTLTAPDFEPINGEGLISYPLYKDRPEVFVGGNQLGSTGYGWWTSNPQKVPKIIDVTNTTDVVTKAFLNAAYPVNVFPPLLTIVRYINQYMTYERTTATDWNFTPNNPLT